MKQIEAGVIILSVGKMISIPQIIKKYFIIFEKEILKKGRTAVERLHEVYEEGQNGDNRCLDGKRKEGNR